MHYFIGYRCTVLPKSMHFYTVILKKQTTELNKKDQLIEKQRIQIDNMIQALLHARKKITVKSYEKTPRKSGVREEMLSGLPKEIEEYIINPEDTCPKCGSKIKVIGKQ